MHLKFNLYSNEELEKSTIAILNKNEIIDNTTFLHYINYPVNNVKK